LPYVRSRSQLILINLGLLFLATLVLLGAWWVNSDFVLEVTTRQHLQRVGRLLSYELQTAFHHGRSDQQIQDLVFDLSSLTDLELSLITDRDGTLKENWSSHPPKYLEREGLEQAYKGENYFQYLKSTDFTQNVPWRLYFPVYVDAKVQTVLVLTQKTSELEKDFVRSRAPYTLLLTLIGFGTIFMSILLMNKIVRPLQELETMARRVADGELERRVRNLGENELGRLGSAINDMAEKLAKSILRFKEEKNKLETILENMDDGLMVFNLNCRLELINKAAVDILNLERERALGKSLPELLIHPDLEDWVKAAIEEDNPVGGEFQSRAPARRHIQTLIALFKRGKEAGEQEAGVIVLLRDLTQLRRLEQVRQDFVANVSHELRTPVTSIRALAETLIDEEAISPEDKERFLRGILEESKRMSHIVNDLLVLAQLDAGKGFNDPSRPFSLPKLIWETVSRLFSPGERRVVINIEGNLPRVAAEEDRIRQVLINLLDNADKYSPPQEEVIITAGQKGGQIEVRVVDHGSGIPHLEQDRIFERFYRVDKAHSRAIGGTGLGLSIVRRIVEGYGGEVRVESEAGQGATFIFTLPSASQAGGIS